jgi:hypothetical protein
MGVQGLSVTRTARSFRMTIWDSGSGRGRPLYIPRTFGIKVTIRVNANDGQECLFHAGAALLR